MATEETVKLNLSDLKGNPNNPRFIREENAEQLKQSISKLWDLSCIVYNERFSRLVGWHQRSNVIQKLIGENPEITITQIHAKPNEVQTTKEGYIEIGTERYKVRFVDFSEEDEALAIIIANDSRNQGEYDMGLLPTIIDIADRSILSADFGMMDFVEGFNIDGFSGAFTEWEWEHVEFDATNNGDENTGETDTPAILTFKISSSDYQRAMSRLEEVKKAQSLDTNEEALLFLLFA